MELHTKRRTMAEAMASTTSTTGKSSRRWFVLLGLVVLLVFRLGFDPWNQCMGSLEDEQQPQQHQEQQQQHHEEDLWSSQNKEEKKKKKFGIISGFVSKSSKARVEDRFLPHLMNKACYAYLWDYDFIFNTTWGFTARSAKGDTTSSLQHPDNQLEWLDFGTWHRVPHMMAALENYEWILYLDVDYVFQDMTRPLDSFVKEWQFHDLDVHVFVPSDPNGIRFTFSAFAVMIKNSPFGRRLLEHWYEFAHGLCPKGNIDKPVGKYDWELSDQPGLWYALARTHAEFYNKTYYGAHCNEHGYLQTSKAMGPELTNYMMFKAKLRKDSSDLSKIPKDQPILWSPSTGGLGVQQTWGPHMNEQHPHAFALHKKKDLPEKVLADIRRCQNLLNCTAGYNNDDSANGDDDDDDDGGGAGLDIRCGSQSNRVV